MNKLFMEATNFIRLFRLLTVRILKKLFLRGITLPRKNSFKTWTVQNTFGHAGPPKKSYCVCRGNSQKSTLLSLTSYPSFFSPQEKGVLCSSNEINLS